MARIGWLFLVACGLASCGEVQVPPPALAEGGEEGAGAAGRAAPLKAGAEAAGRAGAPSEPELLPGGSSGSGVLSVEPRHEEIALPYAVYSWGRQTQGAHSLLRLTSRPKGTEEWPWLTVEAWIRAPRGLEEWVGREIAVHRLDYLPGPGLAPWGLGGRAYLVLREVGPGRLRVDATLELRDPMDGTLQRVAGRLVAVEAGTP